MALDTIVRGSASGTGVEVNASNQLKVVTETDVATNPGNVGAIRVFSENDPGAITGTPLLRSPEISQDYRTRVGVDTLLFSDTFNATVQNTSLWKHAFTTMTMTQSAGFLNINAAGTATVSGNFAYLQTWRHFTFFGTSPISVETTFQFDKYPIANEVVQWGVGVPTGAADVIDGAWFQLTSAGFFGVIRYNSGTPVSVTLINNVSTMPLNTVQKYVMICGEDQIEFWIDDILYGVLPVPNAQGQPFLTTSLPYFVQKYNNGTVGTSPNLIGKVGDVTITLMDLASNQTWANQMASIGLGMQMLNGDLIASGQSPQIQWANAALPTAAAPTNTTQALGAFLGGIFQQNAVATGTTDLIISSYQNPQGNVNRTPRTIKLRGIKIDCVVAGAAVATTPSTFAVAIAWGATQFTLATTADSASFATGTVKGARRQPLGVITFPVGAAVGAAATPIQFDFEAPLVVNPGEFVQVIMKPLVATATASQVFQWIISPNLYHE